MRLRVPQKAGNEMNTRPIVSFLQRAVLHEDNSKVLLFLLFPENLNKSK
jgi:hypothetical protein